MATAQDGADFAEIYRPAVVGSPISFEIEPPDGAEMARRVAAVIARLPWLAFEENGVAMGYAYAGTHRARPAYQWSAEVSAYVHEDARRRGVARALYTSLFELLRLLGYCNAYAGITLPNPASVALHESLGFTSIGVARGIGWKHGAWRDAVLLERRSELVA